MQRVAEGAGKPAQLGNAISGMQMTSNYRLKSHFGYEETELEEALGYFGIEI
ncbi:MAG: hypothetical protein WCB71_03635 [Aestuariivirga sp.]